MSLVAFFGHFCLGRHHASITMKRPIMAIKNKTKFDKLFFSLKIPLLHHAASFNTEAEGGRMVKEWDFEAGKNQDEF